MFFLQYKVKIHLRQKKFSTLSKCRWYKFERMTKVIFSSRKRKNTLSVLIFQPARLPNLKLNSPKQFNPISHYLNYTILLDSIIKEIDFKFSFNQLLSSSRVTQTKKTLKPHGLHFSDTKYYDWEELQMAFWRLCENHL